MMMMMLCRITVVIYVTSLSQPYVHSLTAKGTVQPNAAHIKFYLLFLLAYAFTVPITFLT
jgi:hypothetical protein